MTAVETARRVALERAEVAEAALKAHVEITEVTERSNILCRVTHINSRKIWEGYKTWRSIKRSTRQHAKPNISYAM